MSMSKTQILAYTIELQNASINLLQSLANLPLYVIGSEEHVAARDAMENIKRDHEIMKRELYELAAKGEHKS